MSHTSEHEFKRLSVNGKYNIEFCTSKRKTKPIYIYITRPHSSIYMITDFMITDMLPILILFAGFNVLDVIAHVIRGKLNDAPTSIPLRSTHLCILMFMIVDAAVILILMCRNIVNVAIQIAQLL